MKLADNIILSPKDRLYNILVTGTPGVGVSTYLIDLILQDIQAKHSVIIFDKYGYLVDRIISKTSSVLHNNLAYIDLGNVDYPVGLNIFELKDDKNKQEISNTIINLMYELYDPNRTGIIGPRFEQAVKNAIFTILYDEKATFLELIRCLTDAAYVQSLLPKVKDEFLLRYWKQATANSGSSKSEVIDYIVTKLAPLINNKQINNILNQTKSTIDFLKLIADGKTIIIDFSKLIDNKDAITIISTILMAKLNHALKERADINKNCHLYVDEITFWPQNSIKELLQEGRRLGISLTLAAGRIGEINPSLQRELLRINTLISFRLNTQDAQIIAPEFCSLVTQNNLCLLNKYNAYLKYLKDRNIIITPKPINFDKGKIPASNLSNEQLVKLKSNLHKKTFIKLDI